jgi:phage baseplate assembly protein gpV
LTGKMTDSDGSIEFSDANQTSIRIDASGVTINAPTAEVQVTAAASMSITAPMLTVSAGMTNFTGVVTCPTIIATSVVGTTYTPGAGNIW